MSSPTRKYPICAPCTRADAARHPHACVELEIDTTTLQHGPFCSCTCAPTTRKIMRHDFPRKECRDHPDHTLTLCRHQFCQSVRHWYCDRNIPNPHVTELDPSKVRRNPRKVASEILSNGRSAAC